MLASPALGVLKPDSLDGEVSWPETWVSEAVGGWEGLGGSVMSFLSNAKLRFLEFRRSP